MAQKLIQTNTLQAGALGDVDRNRPSSPRYGSGCEIAENVIPQGGVLTPAPGFGALVPYTYRAQSLPPPDQTYYLRNAAITDQSKPDTATIPSDTVTTVQLKKKIDDALGAGTYWAKKAGDGGVGSYLDTAATPFTGTNTPFWTAADSATIENNATIEYVRAFKFPNPVTGREEWGIVCEKSVSVKDYYGVSWWKLTKHDNPAPTLVLGRGNQTVSKSQKSVTLKNIAALNTESDLTATIKITPKKYTAPSGWFRNPSNDITIVGKMSMFTGAPNITEYSHTATQLQTIQENTVTVSTKDSTPDVSGMEGVYVLFYGAPAAGSVPDDFVVGKDAAWTITPGVTSPSGGKRYYFQTARNIVVGARRIGKALFYDSGDASSKNTADARNFGLAATKIGDGAGNIPGTLATEPWFLTFDSPVQWYEPTYNGVVVGTSASEFVLANEQLAPTASAAGVTVRKISSVGTPLTTNDRWAISTQLNGNILFCTHRGVALMTFSNERQQYLPALIDLVSAGFGAPLSIASSKRYGVIFVLTDKGVIVCLNPETGGITTITGITRKVTSGEVVSIAGLDTVDGEPRVVWVSPTNVTYMCPLEGNTTQPILVRTSRFGAYTGRNGLVQSAYLSLIGAVGGRARVAAGQYQTREFPWVELPYIQGQLDPVGYVLQTGESAQTFTGVMRLEVMDTPDNPSEGKAIELQFLPGEKASIVSVAVEMKEI